MADKKPNDDVPEEFEVTTEEDAGMDEADLADVEAHSKQKMKQLREKLAQCEKEKMEHLEGLQREKADFLNSKRRLEEERLRDRERSTITHIEKLLPLYDSFQMAMNNTDVWERVDEGWRKGIEGIRSQLLSILSSYDVSVVDPTGEPFNPQLHEAMGNQPVEDESQHDTIIAVIQPGFVRTKYSEQELIRPARVIVGTFEKTA